MDAMTELFGEPIHVYTRAEAIADGVLVEVPAATAAEAGFTVPVALTAEAWAATVEWTEQTENRKREHTGQDEAGRLWDVLWSTRRAIAAARGGGRVLVTVHAVPAQGRGILPRPTRLAVEIGPGDKGEPVLTVMLPTQD